MASFQIFNIVLFCFVLFKFCSGQAPYEYDPSSPDNLFSAFEQNSLENIQLFKTRIFKLIEAQNQYFELIQQKRPAIGDYDYVKFDVLLPHAEYRLPLLNDQRLITVPNPNLPSIHTQLLLSISENGDYLNLWQFLSDGTIALVDRYRPGQTVLVSHKDCIKIQSFVTQIGVRKFRLISVALFHQSAVSQNDVLLVFSINFVLEGPQIILQTSFIEEQVIKFERIPDFDLLFISNSKMYMALIQNSDDSNFKYELSLYQLMNHKTYDKIAWQISDYILNARHVKMARLDGGIYLMCSYDLSSKTYSYLDSIDTKSNIINVFQLIENGGAKLAFISAVNNFTTASVKEIHHLSSNNDFFFLVKDDDIDVYWWDGHSLVYYDTLFESRPLAFALEKLPDQPPLILSTDGRSLNLYYKVYSKFIHHRLDLIMNDQYNLENIEIFSLNHRYYVWLRFSGDHLWNPEVQHYCQFARVQSRKPQTNEEMYNLDTCLMDLRDRIEQGLQEVQTLKRTSEELLVISPQQPYIDVDIEVKETLITQRAEPEDFTLRVQGNVLKGDQVVVFLDSVQGRLDHLENRVNNTVMLKSANQTVSSPIKFHFPVQTEFLSVNTMDEHFYLNDMNFDMYANNMLTIDTDQIIRSPLVFENGALIDNLQANKINNLDITSVLSTDASSRTQFVNATHRYHQIELLNGTTATKINDVRLVDVFQDRPVPIQLLRGTKTFSNLTASAMAVDANINNINFQQYLSNVVWLENPNLKHQELIGDWKLQGNISVKEMFISNRINDQIEFDDFVNNVAKKYDRSIILKSPIHFHNQVDLEVDLLVDGSINGLNLNEDLILLHGDQDFSKKQIVHEPLVFSSSTTFSNLTIEVLNDRFRTQDFLRKSRDSRDSKILLRNKKFLNDLKVIGQVTLNPASQLNGIRVRDLYHSLDSFVSLNTPVTAKEIVISGSAYTNKFNEFDGDYVRQKLAHLLLKNYPQTFRVPMTYYGRLRVSKLSFNYYKDSLRFPEDFISKFNETQQDILITGEKYFQQPVLANNIYLGKNSTVNGYRISEFYESLVRQRFDPDQTEQIAGSKTFENLVIDGNVFIVNGHINEKSLEQTIDINGTVEQIIPRPISFKDDITVDGEDFAVQDLFINGTVNSINYPNFWQDVIFRSPDRYWILEMRNKIFPNGLQVNDIRCNGTVDNINVANMLRDSMMVDSVQNVSSSIYFRNATFHAINDFHTINGLDSNYFKRIVRKDSPIVNINLSPGIESILGFWHVKDFQAATVNGYNITDIYSRTLKKNSVTRQTITGKHIFLKPIKALNLELPIETVRINQIPIRNYVWLNSPTLKINTDVIFENLKQVGNLTVHGLINRCDFVGITQRSVKRNNFIFNLTGTYYVPKIVIRGNARFGSTVNQKENFLPNLVRTDDRKPLRQNIHFVDDITVDRILINNLINEKNLSSLIGDAVYKHRLQRITGRKRFKNPIRIIGQIEQRQGKFYITDKFNNVNLTNLFIDTVTFDNIKPIRGPKRFTGNITFRNVNLGQGLNGNQFPDDYVLVYTNETIYGRTNFHKKVRIHRNLNAQLINHINVTKFFHDAILINETIPKKLSSTLRFMQPIKILNLTVHEYINDIPVNDLLTDKSQDIAQITGRKNFKNDLVVNGIVNVETNYINNVNLIKDIDEQWMDRRHLPIKQIQGQIVFENLVHVDQMKINDTLNGIDVKRFREQLGKMEQDIEFYKQAVTRSLRETEMDKKTLVESYISNFISDLKYFKLNQVLEVSVIRLYSISENGRDTKAIVGVGKTNFSSTENCYHFQSRNFLIGDDGNLHENLMPKYWSQAFMMMDRAGEILVVLSSKTQKCSDYRKEPVQAYTVQFWNWFDFLTVLGGAHNLIQIQPEFSLAITTEIESIRLFQSKESEYLLMQHHDTFGSKKLSLYKHENYQLYEMDDLGVQFDASGFDVIPVSDLVLISMVNGFGSNGTDLWISYWDSEREKFKYVNSVQTFKQFHRTKFIPMSDRLLVAIFGQKNSDPCVHENYGHSNLELYEILQQEPYKLQMRQLQPFNSKIDSIIDIQALNVGKSSYLLIHSDTNIELYQWQGYNTFGLKLNFRFPKKIQQIHRYWIDGQKLYLAVATEARKIWILSGLLNAPIVSDVRSWNFVVRQNASDFYEVL